MTQKFKPGDWVTITDEYKNIYLGSRGRVGLGTLEYYEWVRSERKSVARVYSIGNPAYVEIYIEELPLKQRVVECYTYNLKHASIFDIARHKVEKLRETINE